MTEPKIAYVTKYALTSGLKAFPIDMIVDRKTAVVLIPGPGNRREYFHDLEWHPHPNDALARAEDLRTAKIASLKKQVARLEKLRFEFETKEGAE